MASGRPLLVVLLIWALLMIVPDLARVVRPLASFGFYANSDGLIYDVTGPFSDKSELPAWKAGVREGDHLDLSQMRCLPYDRERCADILAAVGGIQYVAPDRTITLDLAQTSDQAARQVTLTAEQRPANWLIRTVLLIDQLAGILVVLAAAWLVWTRPGPMSWGFFSMLSGSTRARASKFMPSCSAGRCCCWRKMLRAASRRLRDTPACFCSLCAHRRISCSPNGHASNALFPCLPSSSPRHSWRPMAARLASRPKS